MMLLRVLIGVVALLHTAVAELKVLEGVAKSIRPEIELAQTCIDALEATIPCDPYLRDTFGTDNYAFTPDSTDLLDAVCTPQCKSALTSYHATVVSACKDNPEPWDGMPATIYGDQLWSAYNTTCLKDATTGEYCSIYFFKLAANITTDMSITGLPQTQACSSCVLSLFQTIQATAYSNYDEELAEDWAALQNICGVSYPTEVQPPVANVTDIPGRAPPGYKVPTTCLSGSTYTVASGDDCAAISVSQNVGYGALIAVNNLLPDCSDLAAGATLCLPQSCDTYVIKSSDTCMTIARSTNTSFTQILAWNPTINPDCTNLISGQRICVSQPGGEIWDGTTIPGATATQTQPYATSTVAPPGPTASGTTLNCGKFYQVQPGDICHLVALNHTITLSLFQQINPSIDQECTNLVPGLSYCVFPTENWNSTTSPTGTATHITAPGPTPTGTTPKCFEYYVVKPGDYCALIQSSFGITFEQFQSWNPSLLPDCSNLIAGYAYCVRGDNGETEPTPSESPPETPTPTPTSTIVVPPSTTTSSGPISTPTPIQPNMAPGCRKFYQAVSGDYCYLICENNHVSQADFIAWNPDVGSDCGAIWLGYWYCVGH